jgi:hypothetical protein
LDPPQISTEQTINSFLKSPSTKKAMTHADGNSGTVMVHSQNVAELNLFSKSLVPAVPLIGGFSCFQNFLVFEEDLIQINFFTLKIF